MAAVASVRGGRRISTSQIFNGAVGVIVVAALIVQSVLNVRTGTVPVTTRFVRMFSSFTVQSNVLVAVAAFGLALAPARDSRPWRVLRLDALVGISVTGVVYTTVLQTQQQLHGYVTGWYPYPFIDVARHGYGIVALNALAVTAVLAVMAAVFWLGDAYLPGGRPRRPAGSLPARPLAFGFAAAPAIADEHVEQPSDHADDDGAPEGRPEPGDVERE